MLIIKPDGKVSTRLGTEGVFKQVVYSATETQQVLVRTGDKNLLMIGQRPETWDGRPDAEPTELKSEWQLSNPVSIDVGADQVHESTLPDGTPITGEGVTVAVVDSGIYFNSRVRDILGEGLNEQFEGEANFTRGGICLNGGEQHDTYCYSDTNEEAVDLYGHGSHVAGIIWSQITDDYDRRDYGHRARREPPQRPRSWRERHRHL